MHYTMKHLNGLRQPICWAQYQPAGGRKGKRVPPPLCDLGGWYCRPMDICLRSGDKY